MLRDRYVGKYFEARLINAPGVAYIPGTTNDANFLAQEVTLGTAGYTRAVIKFESGDLGNYADGGVAFTQKATAFAHDGSQTAIQFTHVALVWSSGNTATLGAVTAAPASMATTTTSYTNIPIDLTTGTGTGMTVDLAVTNSGAATTDYTVTLNKPGIGYNAGDALQITNGTLAGLDPTAGAGSLDFSVATVSAITGDEGNIFTVTRPTNAVSLIAGNEAVFYWNVKQFGFYSQS